MRVTLSSVAAAAGTPEEAPPVEVSLRGPFGTVTGTDVESPAVAAPDGLALHHRRRAVQEEFNREHQDILGIPVAQTD